MPKLSPAAQAVWDAAWNTPEDCPYEHDLAAALEAVADQVVPEQVEPPSGETEPWTIAEFTVHWPQGYQLMRDAQWEKCQQLRSEIIAIAAELKAHD